MTEAKIRPTLPAVPLFAPTLVPLSVPPLPSSLASILAPSDGETKTPPQVKIEDVTSEVVLPTLPTMTLETKISSVGASSTILKLSAKPPFAAVPKKWIEGNPHFPRMLHPIMLEKAVQDFYNKPTHLPCRNCSNKFDIPPKPMPMGFKDGRYQADGKTAYCSFQCIKTRMMFLLGHEFNNCCEMLTDMARDVYGYDRLKHGPIKCVDVEKFEIWNGIVNHAAWLRNFTLTDKFEIVGYPFVDTPVVLQYGFKDIATVRPKTKKKAPVVQVTPRLESLVASARADGEDMSGITWSGTLTKEEIAAQTIKVKPSTDAMDVDDSPKSKQLATSASAKSNFEDLVPMLK
jgi:hypothetical protein